MSDAPHSPRRRDRITRARGDDPVIEVETVDGADTGGEIVLRPVTTNRQRRVVLALGAVAVVVLAAVVFSHGGGTGTTAPTTTAPATTVAPSTTVAPVTTLPPVTIPTTTPTSAPGAVPFPLGRTTGLVLYLSPDGAPTSIDALDIDSGVVHRVELGQDVGWFIRVVEVTHGVVVDSGAIVGVTAGAGTIIDDGSSSSFSDAPDGRVAAGPNGFAWVRRSTPPEIELVDAKGASTGIRHALALGSDLFGSMADGRPVVRSADGHLIVIDTSGNRTVLAANGLAPVDAGRFAEYRCDIQQSCSVIAHIDDRQVPLGLAQAADGGTRAFRFQPGGNDVAISEGGHLTLVDTITGHTVDNVVDDLISGLGVDNPGIVFLPGDAGLVASTNHGIVLIDLQGQVRATLSPRQATGPGGPLLGVGTATPWR